MRRWSPRTIATALRRRLLVRLRGFEPSEDAILLAFALAIGVGSAFGVVLFYRAIDLAYTTFYRIPGDTLSRWGIATYRPVMTALSLALAWWVMRRIGHGHDGLNVPDVQLAAVRRGGVIPGRPALARTLASAITIGGGGSGGSEGPVVVLGATIGSVIGRFFRFTPERMRVLLGAGAGAAISAAFNAPIAGAFFALEEILGSLAIGAFPPIVVASVIAAVVSRAFLGNHPAFPIPVEYGYGSVRELVLFFPILGIVTGLMAALFVRTYFAVDAYSQRFRRYGVMLPLAGGLIVGALVVLSGGLLVGYGHLAVHLEVFGRMAWYWLALLAVGSIVATSVTLTTGGSGGLFTPSLYVGAATGGAVGVALAALFPGMHLRPETYAIVGMGALVASSTHAPITGILLVFEMTNDYAVVVPLMLTTVLSYLVARRLEPDSLYSGWLRRRGERIESGADRDVLAGLRVADAYDESVRTFAEDAPVSMLVEQLGRGEQTMFPVVDVDGGFVGVITLAELGQIAREFRTFAGVVVAADVARPTETVAPGESLLEATRRMGLRGVGALPVVDRESEKLLGMLTRSHVLAAYERALAATEPLDAHG